MHPLMTAVIKWRELTEFIPGQENPDVETPSWRKQRDEVLSLLTDLAWHVLDSSKARATFV
jgi:hypothetical protein